MIQIKRKLYIDFDNTLVCSIKCVCDLYNEDFKYFPDFKPVNWVDMKTWEFNELNLASREYVLTYFGQPRFFEHLEFMDNAYEVLLKLINDGYEICIVSMGTSQNLLGKKIWLEKHLPGVKFVGCDFNTYKNKSHIDMSDGILIDDEKRYLDSSNASIKICFGYEYEWNKDWKELRCRNWHDVIKKLRLEN